MRFEWNRGALREIRTGPLARSMVDTAAAGMANRAGPGFDWNGQAGTERWRALVYPTSWQARRQDGRENTLVRVMYGGVG